MCLNDLEVLFFPKFLSILHVKILIDLNQFCSSYITLSICFKGRDRILNGLGDLEFQSLVNLMHNWDAGPSSELHFYAKLTSSELLGSSLLMRPALVRKGNHVLNVKNSAIYPSIAKEVQLLVKRGTAHLLRMSHLHKHQCESC